MYNENKFLSQLHAKRDFAVAQLLESRGMPKRRKRFGEVIAELNKKIRTTKRNGASR